ncbi:MAG TPA: tetratricopeptide repeat protein [Terriglobia bacterium]
MVIGNLARGDVLDRYRVEHWLGQGGMGVVYRARDLRLGRPVALKLLHKQFHDNPSAWGLLLAEARTASSLNHPNICTIYEAGEYDGQPYISMEYVEGDLLSLRVPPTGLPADSVVGYATQIADALEHAHQRGVIHRDIKSANVMLTPEGRVKVLDFGLAQQLLSSELTQAAISRTSLRELGSIAGTIPYMAPELLRGKPASISTDLWSLGVVIHEMTTGELPFKGDTAFELSMAIMMDSKVTLPPRIPGALRPVVERCLEKDPARRYQQARDISEDLGARSASSERVSINSPFPRNRAGVAAAALLLVATLVLAVPSLRHRLFRPASVTATRTQEPAGLPSTKVIVVAPFRALGESAAFHYIAEGFAEALSAKLFQLNGLRIIPATDMERVDGQKSIDQVGKKLGANLAITGVVQGAGDQIRVVVTLRDLTAARLLWTQEFSGSRTELLTIEDRAFRQLVSALGLTASPGEIASISAPPTGSVDAYDLYLRGRDALRNFRDASDISKAIDLYGQALKQDPKFALAWAGMSDASLEMYGQKEENFWAEKALHAAQQAVHLNPRLAEAHFALGSVYYATGHPDQAAAEIEHALQIDPNSDEGYRRLGSTYLAAGRKAEAIAAYQKAIKLSPYFPDNYQMLGDAYLDMEENEKALSAYQRLTELEPDNVAGYNSVGAAYCQAGQWNKAIDQFQKALEVRPSSYAYSNLGLAYFYLQRYAEAVSMFEKAVEMKPDEATAVGNLADAYRWSGQKDKAAATYDRAIGLANQELQVNARDPEVMGDLALYYAKRGDAGQAAILIRRARALNPASAELIYADAVVRALAGQPQEALQGIRQAFLKGYSVQRAASDPELSSLRGLPQFSKLMREFASQSN